MWATTMKFIKRFFLGCFQMMVRDHRTRSLRLFGFDRFTFLALPIGPHFRVIWKSIKKEHTNVMIRFDLSVQLQRI